MCVYIHAKTALASIYSSFVNREQTVEANRRALVTGMEIADSLRTVKL